MVDFERLRRSMVDSQLRPNDVTDPRILAAMLELPRERFVPDARRALAYLDDDLPVRDGSAGAPARYLLEPMILARMIQALDLSAEASVLDIGGATGYSAALLARLAGRVVALEEDAALVAAARKTLSELGRADVEFVTGPLREGASQQAPFDAILINGSVEAVPEPMFTQLRDGGRLVAVLRNNPPGRAILHVRTGGAVSRRPMFDAAVPPLPGFEVPRGFVF